MVVNNDVGPIIINKIIYEIIYVNIETCKNYYRDQTFYM